MTYTEREIARPEGMKDGLIKKLVEECEEINDQIIALRKGTPRKKDSEIYFDRGYAKGREDAIDDLVKKVCEFGTALEHEECYAISPTTMKQTIADFGEQLKEQNNECK